MRKAEREKWERDGYTILEPTQFTGRQEYVMVKTGHKKSASRCKFLTATLTIAAILILAVIMAWAIGL